MNTRQAIDFDCRRQLALAPALRDQGRLEERAVSETAYHLSTRGFHVLEGFLKPEDCDFFKQRLAAATEQDSSESHHIHDLLARDVAFCALLEDPRLQQLVEPLLGRAWVMYAFTTSSIPPSGINYGHRIHVDSPRLIPGYPTNVGLIWALDPFTSENGGTEVLPGSHHSEVVPNSELFEANRVQVHCGAGSLVVFQARLFHRAGANRTLQWRRSLTMNVCRPFMKQRMDWVRLIPKDFSDVLNDQARRLIGFDTRIPTSMEEYSLPEKDRLYKANQE